MNTLGFIVSGIVTGLGTAFILNEHAVSRLYETDYADSENGKTYFTPIFGRNLVEIQPYMHLSKIAKIINVLSLAFLGALAAALIQGGIATIGPMLLACPLDFNLVLSHAKIGAIIGLMFGFFTEPKIQNSLLNTFMRL